MGRRGKPQQNLVGQRFNHLTVLEMIPGNLSCKPSVRCQCDCGNIVIATTSNVKRGNTKSCGCIKHGRGGPRPKTSGTTVVCTERKNGRGTNPKDLTGQRYGRLTVTGTAGYDKHRHVMYECRCDCGKTCTVRGGSLTGGNTKSCGCYRAIKSVELGLTHGDSRPSSPYNPIYHIWCLMRDRCTNPNNEYYKDYGGRGITVCEEWEDWTTFKTWALSHHWEKGLTLDRIEVNGNYEPDNCRWADAVTQARNTRRSVRVDWEGRNISVYDWARQLGLPYESARTLIASGEDPNLVKDFLTVDRPIQVRHRPDSLRIRRTPSVEESCQTVRRTLDNAPMRGRKREDLTSRTFGYLTVIRMCDPTPNGRSYAECECVCGTVKRVLASNLKSGKTKSCGCMKNALITDRLTKHGDSLPESRYFDLYKVWTSMRRRNHVRKYVDTGKRIGVCPEWESWLSFKAWALSSGYMPGLYLARLRKDEPFSPDNCVWVSEGEPLVSPEGGFIHR